MNQIKRGDIYYIDLSPAVGSEQGGIRPCVIVQNDTGNKFSPTTIIVPLTTQAKTNVPTHTEVHETPYPSIALCEQIRVVDKNRIKGERIAKCKPHTMTQIDMCLTISIGVK